MTHAVLGLVFLGAFAGGLVNGLTGFGTGMTALPIWVNALPPLLASPLTVACSVVGQLQTLPAIWHAMDRRRLAPFVIGGVVGVPLGVALLPRIDAHAFRIFVGIVLIATCALLLVRRRRFAWKGGGRMADAGIGAAGGVFGGLAGLSGILPTLWAELRGWEKDERRAVFQGYNLAILSFAFVAQAGAGFLDARVGLLLVVALPGTAMGAFIGRRIYSRLDTQRFAKIVLAVLLAGGVGIIVTALR